MTCHYFFAQPPRYGSRSLPVFLQHLVEILLRAHGILFPPPAKGGHIMGKYGGHTPVRIFFQPSEFQPELLGHGLNLKRQDAQIVHDPRDAFRHHAQIFGTHQHLSRFHQDGQFTHGLLVPELVVPMVIILVV